MRIETPDPNAPPSPWAWLIFVVLGLLMLAGAVSSYSELSAMEQNGGTMKINWLFAFLYRAFGKLGVVIPMVLMGGGFLWGGYRSFVDSKERQSA